MKRRSAHRPARREDGFVLLESIVAIAMITIIMAALTVLFLTTIRATNHQRFVQAAVRIATDMIDQARAVGAGNCSPESAGPSCPAFAILPATRTVNNVGYTISHHEEWCTVDSATGAVATCDDSGPRPYVRSTVDITWRDTTCLDSGCHFVTSVILSAATDPTFPLRGVSLSPHLADPQDRTSVTGDPIDGRILVSGGVSPYTFALVDAPTWLTVDASSGELSGTTGAVGVYSGIRFQVTDARGSMVTSAPFTWTIVAT